MFQGSIKLPMKKQNEFKGITSTLIQQSSSKRKFETSESATTKPNKKRTKFVPIDWEPIWPASDASSKNSTTETVLTTSSRKKFKLEESELFDSKQLPETIKSLQKAIKFHFAQKDKHKRDACAQQLIHMLLDPARSSNIVDLVSLKIFI